MDSNKTILVTGATGKQGGAIIDALVSSPPSPPFKILAVTRDKTSKSAQALALKPNVSLLEGDFNDLNAVFKEAGNVWGVYSVQVWGNEEAQGKALVDAAVANGVEHFVYSSVDRGGPSKSDTDPTNVPHFATKYNIEKYLIEKAAASPQGMTWTILRPVGFYDNLTPDFMGKVFVAMWNGGIGNKKLQLVSTKDIGVVGATAFRNPKEYRNQSLSLAGDELTLDEAKAIFKEEMGKPMPTTFTVVGSVFSWAIGDLGKMWAWFSSNGYGTDIAELKKKFPELQDFRTWLRESSVFAKKK